MFRHSNIVFSDFIRTTQRNKDALQCVIPSFLQRSYSKSMNNDELVLKEFVNRNPRNMELFRIQRKPQGFGLDSPSINYYYKLKMERRNQNITAWVEHNLGRKVVLASTNEWAIRKHLYSSIDTSAAENLGRILAQRCHQAGIYEVHTELKAEVENSQRVQLFLKALEDGGITLEESPQIREKQTYPTHHKIPTMPWEVTEEDVEAYDKLSENLKEKASE